MCRLLTATHRVRRAARTTPLSVTRAALDRGYLLLVALIRAADEGTALRITYRKADGSESQRTIQPADVWPTEAGDIACRAHDRSRGEDRTFRVDRITSYHLAA